jgi:hypothetical protein
LPLLFPLAAGFALIGPFAAIVFYDLSRQRERGVIPRVAAAMDIIRSTSSIAIGLLGAMLAALLLTWVATAQSIYNAFFGFAPVFSMPGFFREHANKALALSARPTRCNVIGGGDGPGLPASRCVARPGFPQDKKTKDGTNKDAMTKDAMSKDRVKDDGMAKGTMRRRGVPLSSSIGE